MPKAVTQPSGDEQSHWVNTGAWVLLGVNNEYLDSNVIGSQYEKTEDDFILIENSLNQIQETSDYSDMICSSHWEMVLSVVMIMGMI